MIVALSAGVAYLILLGLVLYRRTRRNPAEGWLVGYCAYSAALMGLHTATLFNRQGVALPDPIQPLVIVGFIFSIALTGYLTLSYLALSRNLYWGWTILLVIWSIAVAAAEISQAPALLGEQGTILPFPQISLGLEVLFFGWVALAVALFGLVARTFLGEPLPLYANRILFWYVVVPFLLLGDALAAWVSPPWNYVGYGVRLLGTVAAVYGVVSHRIVDLRDAVRRFISYSIQTLVTAALILAGIIVAINVMNVSNLSLTGLWLVAVGVSFAVAILMQPVRRLLSWLLRHFIERDQTDIAEAVRLYSQRVGAILDLKEFASTAARTADELLSARRGCLIMATQQNDQIILETVGTDRVDASSLGHMSATSPIYRHFTSTSDALLQYDIDYQKDYRGVPPAERKYFSSLQMDIFAPIIKDSKLIGILALGPKLNDDPYRSGEIVLISALANQTVTALENARLVTDLRSLNAEISSLNEDLRQTNERLERLDSVKSDFISIASHELRTPLTQIQGYADLLLEMSERNLLSPDQTIEITGSLRAASQRMGEVISSMLDVSQIDVENMDLSFVETSLASIIKLAIEPYSDAIHQRNLTLVARGLRNLPPVYGDYKRLVQAFEALITNAIKFTPDGGKINVTGEIFEKDTRGQPKSIRITVEDTGIGIDKEHHELIFEKFYRIGPTALHSTGVTKFKGAGPGLGLPIAKGIIQGHGGRIWVESEGCDEDKLPGTKFHVVLPVQSMMSARERIQQFKEVVGGGTDDGSAKS